MKIEQLSTLSESSDELVILLNDCVESGASIGFLAPLEAGEAERYWQGVSADLAEGGRTLLIAREAGRIAGTVQISYCPKKNGIHRAEVEKLMVHTAFRQRGIAQQLMAEVERQAQANQRTLLVLDTRTNDTASILYRKLGYQEAGQIPQFARSSAGTLDGTTFFYKLL
ncbi:GNAT family N-acetyltransferase [Pectobacterium polaris]|uniref:GNAT family N-acetyltransferase n=1 Tax=Pectobacterium polaris TaxID=2042057 RepID=A0AAW4NZH6_9GAMM|nr:GNAT family N-acetyltransferase [Pectobacterium polaris]ASY82356.1 GNAT family N-acetyltransferase [Pectobacterium polaris]MBW5892589.1 GNAT family N-acetyltransferase [Pectobacterium polaris]MCA6939578.1 GNAT family N-acetyltransferase [Pectobacterium polaris]MCA6958801.1 GNAT family N-acetyltransferase [Pectobacterium polaris]MCL6360554.1 GNAT family N-acetyltransferase [Pectobacterium polaris]